jgi:hypothetical protein
MHKSYCAKMPSIESLKKNNFIDIKKFLISISSKYPVKKHIGTGDDHKVISIKNKTGKLGYK